MLSSGVESQERSHSHPLDSSMSAVVQELYTGLPVSISTELTTGSDPNVRLDTKAEASTLVLAHSSSLLSESPRISGVENCSQETDNLDHGDKLTSDRLAGSLSEESMEAGNLAENEEAKSGRFGKQDTCANGSQKEERRSMKETQDAEEELVGCCSLASEEKWWLRQEKPQINRSGGEFSRHCCTEMASPLKSKEENQTNVQEVPEILPKLTEEVQGMKADGTRIFSKAGHRNDRVSKGLPPENNECPDIATFTASGEFSETNTLVPLEPLTVVETGSTKEDPQEEKEYKGLTACTAVSLTTMGCAIFESETGEIELSRSSHVNKTNAAPASYQTYQQDEENSPHNRAVPVSKSSVEVDIFLSKGSSEALCGSLRSLCSLESGNIPLEDNTTEICEKQEYLAEERESPSCDGDSQRTEFLENWIAKPVMEEQLSPVQSEEMSSDEAEQLETDSCSDHSYNYGYGKVAEIQRETAMKSSCGMDSGHDIQENVNSQSSNSLVPSSVASSTEEFPKEDLRIPSEINNLKKDEDQRQICIDDVFCADVVKQHTKENGTLLVETKNVVSIQTGNLHTCSKNSYNKYVNSPPTVHDFLDYGSKVGEVSLEAQLFEKETNSSSVVEDLNNSFGKAPEANSVNVSLPTCKGTNFAYTLSEALSRDAENSRVSLGVISELSSCNADAVSNRDVYLDRRSKKELIISSAKLEAQHAGLLHHKKEELSLLNHRSFSTSNVASKGSQKSMHSAWGDTEKMVTDMENEESDIGIHNGKCLKDRCSAVKTCIILSDSASLDNATLNKDSFKAQAKLKTEEVNGLETGDLLIHNDKKAISPPEENTHVACESVPCEDSCHCSNMFQYMTNRTSTAEKLLCSACTPDKSTTRLSKVENSDTNIEVESSKLYDGHSEITEERLDSGTRERTSDTGKGQEQINSCELQKDEIDRIETVDSVKAHKGSHQNETSEQSVNRDLKKNIFGIHLELGNTTVVLGEGELEMCKKTVLPCEYNLSKGTTSKSDTDSGIPSHEKHLAQSFDLELSDFKHSKQPNKTICQVENQYLACQSELNGPVSYKQNEIRVADEVLEFQQYDIANKQISNTGVQTMTSSVDEPKRSIRFKENEPLTLKKDEGTTPLVDESLREKSFQGTFRDVMVDNSSNSMVDTDCSEYTDSISNLSEGEKVELKESDNVGSGTREDQGTFKGNMVGYSSSKSLVNADHSEYTDSTSSAKEDKKERTILTENTKISALLNTGSLVMSLENKIKTIVESFSVSQSAFKSLSCAPEDMTLVPEITNETCLLLDSSVNHRIIERNKACPQPELVTFTVSDGPERVNPVQPEEFCGNQELSILKGVTSKTLLAQNSEICLPQKDELPALLENAQINPGQLSSANALCNDYSALELIESFERRADGNDSASEEREKAISSLNDAVQLEACTASHAHSKGRSVSAGVSEPIVKEMDVISSDSIDCVQKFKRPSVEDQRQSAVTAEKIKMPMHSIFDHKNYLGVLLKDLKFSVDKVRSCVPLKAEPFEKPSQAYSTEQIPEWSLNSISDKGKTYVKDHSELGDVKLLSEIVDNYLQSKDLVNKERSEVHYNAICNNKLSNDYTETPLKCLNCSEVCLPYELSSQSKDNRKEVIGDKMKMPNDSVSAENEVSDAERLDKVGECQTRKRKMSEETEVHPAQNILLCEEQAQQIKESNNQEKAKVPLQESVVFDREPLDSSSDELVTSSRVMKTEGPREQLFAVMSSINDSDNKQIYSTLQEAKRPKISKNNNNDDDSEHMKTMDSEGESLSFHLGTYIELSADNTPFIPVSLSQPQTKSFAGDDEIHGTLGNAHKLRGLFSLKKQPRRKVPAIDMLKTVRKSNKVKSSAFKRNWSETVPMQEHKLLSSVYFACKPSVMEAEIAMRLDHMSEQRANRFSLLNSLKLSKCTKEPTLLSRLSTMASKLLAPPKSIHRLKTLQCSSEHPVVERFSQLRSKKLLEIFSCINMKLNSHQADGLCTKMFSLQPLALYPVDSTKIHILDLSSNIPSSVFNTSISPISFHIKLNSDSLINLRGITSQQYVPDIPALEKAPLHPSQSSKWTFSFLLSQSCSGTAAFREDTNLSKELQSSALSLITTETVIPNHDIRRIPIAKRTGCSMLGLHTVLALSSPGCYRIWTRRRNVTSRIPTVQRLFMSQFTQGLKGLRSPTSVSDDLFSSLPYSLGRVLSIWSQHGPSACLSEFTPLHPSHCKWQPSLSIENSYSMLPHMTVQGTEAARTTGAERRLERSLCDLLPKSCTFPESAISPLRLSIPELQVHPFDELDASLPLCPTSQSATKLKKAEPEKRPKRVSQIRIRKTVPKPDPNLTPMGLPRAKRLKKKEFSLEEIYTNKNYKSPPATRCLETIFEEPKEKNGSLISISQQKRKRILEFQDFTIPRKRKARSRVKVTGSFTRAKKAALQGRELDALLIQKLMDLEAFFAEEEEREQASGS
ncbi:protein PRR14L isoform X1 [Gopherus evgoodei]|uniref:Proline rich 14 like n=2 Tax=Gopherus evgoodei TaxID=1825980 RepID=A0A8C4YE86_9SAUR|nr:protein PRR14L isoform X1 [Gopherus evgoodei]XP_030439218.1 protein PRR14L isoform X1 [Gopherus evgoodei]XP_030439219.1 protein PRR14L isoform X1 [Gopherus evgoodei]XP_030439220.1 protein PRR14L isoform X1 [Gopherus evgoodei]XP_030439221.1 protein PRR14L isoform X1 [Gopherus evgoodei]